MFRVWCRISLSESALFCHVAPGFTVKRLQHPNKALTFPLIPFGPVVPKRVLDTLCSAPPVGTELQVRGSLSVLVLFGLRYSHADALQPFLCMLLVLRLQHVRPTVCEDLERSRQAAVPPLFGHHLHALHFA